MSRLLFLLLALLAGSKSQRSGRKALGEGKIVGFMCMLYEFILIGVYACVEGVGSGVSTFSPFFSKLMAMGGYGGDFLKKRSREREIGNESRTGKHTPAGILYLPYLIPSLGASLANRCTTPGFVILRFSSMQAVK